jgi:hypothetical protein
MDEHPHSGLRKPPEIAPGALAAPASDPAPRRTVRRLGILLGAGLLAFAATVWMLVRVEWPLAPASSAGARRTVRAHLDALNRGQYRTAYSYFSARYRDRVPFAAYEQVVAHHPDAFRTQGVEFGALEQRGGRIQLEARLISSSGEHFVARFALVQAGGRWWIDGVRWGNAPPRRRIQV